MTFVRRGWFAVTPTLVCRGGAIIRISLLFQGLFTVELGAFFAAELSGSLVVFPVSPPE